MKIIITGDVHGRFHFLDKLRMQESPDLILVCGDFGYWPDWGKTVIHNKKTVIRFADGNHDDLPALFKLEDNEIIPNVFYQKRGSYITLPDGRNVLFMGGALSAIISQGQIEGIDLFPIEEVISNKDFDNLPDPDKVKIDIVISHTCPEHITPAIRNATHDETKGRDCSTVALGHIMDMYKPSQWFFGHWHHFMQGIVNGCEWTCLSYASFRKEPEDTWWIIME